jgi:hypothetical protein
MVIDDNNVLAVLVIVKLEQDVKILLNVFVVAFIVARSILTAVILLPILVSILVTPGGIDIFFNAVHAENALAPIVFTLNGIVIVGNLLQLLNALTPIFVIVAPDVNKIDVKLVQLLNAESDIFVTLIGIIHDNKLSAMVSEVLFVNVRGTIDVIPLFNV